MILYCPDNGTPTSIEAAEAKVLTVRKDEARVYAAFVVAGRATDEEVQQALGMDGNTQRPRRLALVRRGLLKPDGVKLTRKGRKAVAYIPVREADAA